MNPLFRPLVFCGLIAITAQVASAAIIGTNVPALPVTSARIAALPPAQQPAWKDYLERSERQMRADQLFLQNEMREHGVKQVIVPPERKKNLPLEESAEWYAGPEASRIADVVLSFQTPAGGWSKNLNMTGNPRSPGMHFAPDNASKNLGVADFDAPLTGSWNYVGTFDNNATITQLHYLAKVIAATPAKQNEKYRAAFLRGMDYIFASQYPNGGWPQVWPIQGGYHDGITLNDDAMLNVLGLTLAVASDTNRFAFIPADVRAKAAEAYKRGLDCLLALQVTENGHRAIWCQQYDALTLQPASARNYEMPAMAAGESGGILLFFMRLPNPDDRVVAAVHSAAAWFQKTAIRDSAFKKQNSEVGRMLISTPGNGPVWARYYEIGTDRPIFGDRDKTIHDTVTEISKERRNGYAWYGDTAKRALEHYARWSKLHPAK